MRIQLCPCPQVRQLRHRAHNSPSNRSKGQVLVLFAFAIVVMILFVGLAIDAGSVYTTYGQLKRAVDAASVAAANNFKRLESGMSITDRINQMKVVAAEAINMHNIAVESSNVTLYICDADGDGQRDASLQTLAPQFYARCPDTVFYSPRKLVYVKGSITAPIYFFRLIGLQGVPLSTDSTSEAAAVDVVLVIDVSESMGINTYGPLGLANKYDPDSASTTPVGCNLTNTCHPLLEAKEAAKAFVDRMFDGYDRVSVVTFDSIAEVKPIENKLGVEVALSDSLSNAKDVIDTIKLHDDPPFAYMWPYWISTVSGDAMVFNPMFADDRDGNGADADPSMPTCDEAPSNPQCCTVDDDRFDEDPKFAYTGWGGVPCDDSTKFDAFNWDGVSGWTAADEAIANAWLAKNTRDPDNAGPLAPFAADAVVSTCTGCGIRRAADVLKGEGRPGAVWVIVFLSDGVVNMSDTKFTLGTKLNNYPIGFCGGQLGGGMWTDICIDYDTTRYCIDDDSTTCAPSTTYDSLIPSVNFSTLDYAMDMADETALTKSTNPYETRGNDIAIYAIGLGDVGKPGTGVIGENLLRYMASVGDDGDRETNPCDNIAITHQESCGQYYYAVSGDALLPIFEDIATRIYTRITE